MLKKINILSILIWSVFFIAKAFFQEDREIFFAYILFPVVLGIIFVNYEQLALESRGRKRQKNWVWYDVGLLISINCLSLLLFNR
ncbi:hypothetical protein AGMMS49545_17980 [Betaproteobacteria bacterium]|nr:hypothetical protein AGMMS49545_17980 [Betaproteobacteria bacterium]GHU44682.1 hypothetical protein AGMMS50289_13560 [Betaproteobacteria bacterium]